MILARLDARLSRAASWLAGALAVTVAAAIPVMYFFLGYQYQSAALQTETEIKAQLVTRLINENPELWRFEEHRLEELLARRAPREEAETRRVLDRQGAVVVSYGTVESPFITRSAELLDSGRVVGKIEAGHSLRPLLFETILAALLGVPLGAAVYFVARLFPLRALKQAQDSLFEEKERAQVTLHSIGDGVIGTDAACRVDYLNPVAERLSGWTIEEARGLPLDQVFNVVNEDTGAALENLALMVLSEGNAVSAPDRRGVLIQRNGSVIPVEDSAAPIFARDGRTVGVVLVFQDVSKSRDMEYQLSYQASTDPLTGLVNRREFEKTLARAVAGAKDNGEQHTLCYMDLDQFKIVNDTCGHLAGDELLRQLSHVLRSKKRRSDCLARVGGDEFALLLEGCPLDQAQRSAQAMLQAVQDFRFTWQDKTFSVGASIGLVGVTSDTKDASEILSAADVTCYAAKELGRNRVHVYQPDDLVLSRRQGQMQWVTRITQALDEDRFRLYYQTIKPLAADAPEGDHFEVLLRMVDEDGQLVLPGAFIPAAERYNLMPAIDRWVIKTAFATLGRLYKGDIGTRLHTCAINLSGVTWSDDMLSDYIQRQAAQHNIPPRSICFEITETAAITNLTKAISFIQGLKAAGFRFSLDDFGSGVSSFGYLKQLPVDFLKIDGNFVKNMVGERIDHAMVETINKIGKLMGISTVAEFVENDGILAKVREIGVDNAQGYGIAKPLPLDSMVVK